MNDLPNRTVVTGASSGIGREIAIELAKRASIHSGDGTAARFVIHFRRNTTGAEQTAHAIEELGVETRIVAADIREPDQRHKLVEEAWNFLGSPTTWVNNAGADVLTSEMRNWSFEEKLKALIETDVVATIDLSRTVVRRWQSPKTAGLPSVPGQMQAPPSITFIGWDQAPLGMEGDAGQMFGTVKAAVMAFANSLAQEVAPQIRVNTVAPGWIKTAWGQSTDSYWDRRARTQSLMQRWGTPGDVAKAVAYVADPTNTFCCGQTIAVNGGWNRLPAFGRSATETHLPSSREASGGENHAVSEGAPPST